MSASLGSSVGFLPAFHPIDLHAQGVAKNFRSIFAELVPRGRGELVMVKARPAADGTDGEDDETPDAPPIAPQYSAVGVKVRPLAWSKSRQAPESPQ